MSVYVSVPDQVDKHLHEAKKRQSYLYDKLSTSIYWAKLTRWEFWPFSVFYFPVLFYWTWLVMRTRSFFFFTSSNPGIEFGGMLGESKDKIYKNIDPQYLPKTYKLS